MAEFLCSKCGAELASEDEICTACDEVIDAARTPSQMAPPPPRIPTPVPTSAPPQDIAVKRALPRVVGDIMTRKLATLFEGESLAEAEAGLKRVRFRHVPVIGADGFFIGLVSEREILRASPSVLDAGGAFRQAELLKTHRVGDVMARNVKTASANTPLDEAGQLMIDERTDCLPVTDESGKLIGLVTATDYIGLAVKLLRQG